MARKARPTSKSRKTSLPDQSTRRVRNAARQAPQRTAPSGLDFHEARAPKGAIVADTSSYHYAIKPVASGWELRIYERTNGSGEGQNPGGHELFASHSKTMTTKSACTTLALAFHNLGDSFNEFAHGYRSRFSQALFEVENPGQKTQAPRRVKTASTSPASVPVATTARPPRDVPESNGPRAKPTSAPSGVSVSRVSATRKHIGTASPRRPSAEELRKAGAISRKRVYVNRDIGYFHASTRCKVARNVTHWCTAGDAYRSHLRPCPRCSTTLAIDLERYLETTSSGRGTERQPLRLIQIGKKAPTAEAASRRRQPRSKKGTPGRRTGSRRSGAIPYGNPSDIDDIRFSHRTAAEWGTSSFRQHPEEFLGTPTEDDHDWRGRNSLYE